MSAAVEADVAPQHAQGRVRDSCRRGGSANPINTAIAVMRPIAAGARLAGGRSTAKGRGESAQEPLLRKESNAAAQHRRDYCDGEELQDIDRQRERARSTQGLQQGHCVQVALDITAG